MGGTIAPKQFAPPGAIGAGTAGNNVINPSAGPVPATALNAFNPASVPQPGLITATATPNPVAAAQATPTPKPNPRRYSPLYY